MNDAPVTTAQTDDTKRFVRIAAWDSRRASAITGGIGILLLVALAILALIPAQLAPYDPTALVGAPMSAPDAQFVLGTNDIGQDLLSELIWSTRISLSTGLLVALIAVGLGTVVGLITGYTHGMASVVLMRLADLTLALPFLPLVILLSAYLGRGQGYVIAVLALVSWAAPARIIRSQLLALQHAPYIEAARALGCSRARVMLAHLLPAVRLLAFTQFILVTSASIMAESSLSFLGLGDPSAKSWGAMLYFARTSGAFLSDAWRWWVLPAGAMITASVLSLVLIGHALERRLEPAPR